MERAYKLKKSVIIKLLEHLHNSPAFVLQDADIFQTALKQYGESNADFSDCIILAHVRKMGLTASGKIVGRNGGSYRQIITDN